MSDMIEVFRAMNDFSKNQRATRRDEAPSKLDAAGLSYSSNNEGAHLIVMGEMDIADFWPGTSRWKLRKGNTKGFGIDKLTKAMAQ